MAAHRKETFRKGIYVLPNIFTTLNAFCGFHSIISSIGGDYVGASMAILLAVVFDVLDGKIARATNTTSRFGVEYDSLSDLISFGVAPAVLVYLWVLTPLGKPGWLAGFLFMICGALRLARFNTTAEESPGNFFQGLPIPAGAGMCATTVMFCSKVGITGSLSPWIFLVELYALAYLMVSSIPYESFKKAELFRRMRFQGFVALILIFVFIVSAKSIALFFCALLYVVSGPLLHVPGLREKFAGRSGGGRV